MMEQIKLLETKIFEFEYREKSSLTASFELFGTSGALSTKVNRQFSNEIFATSWRLYVETFPERKFLRISRKIES